LNVLELKNLTKRFAAEVAVDRLSFAVEEGEIFTLLGPSGCGKSTTLRMVAGLEHPDGGEIVLNGRTVASAGKKFFLPPERRNMGMVFQSYAIWPHMTVLENVAFPLKLRPDAKQRAKEQVMEVLAAVGLEGFADRPATLLSGGQQQRVALARALVYRPEILLLDEPLSNLDAKLREQMRVEIRSIVRRFDTTVLYVTHDQAEAMTLSSRIAVMNRGQLEQLGRPAEIYERPATPFVRDFLGQTVLLPGKVRRGAEPACVEMDSAGHVVPLQGSLQDFADGVQVNVACRAESFTPLPPGAPVSNQLQAVIEDVYYLGSRVDYSVRVVGRSFTVQGEKENIYPPGSNVLLRINPKGITVWRHEQ
jgi:ABC-type Fe3+/spermidine/putrescine transport system ATPase subunit